MCRLKKCFFLKNFCLKGLKKRGVLSIYQCEGSEKQTRLVGQINVISSQTKRG